MKFYQTVIIGGGPAGASLGFLLQKEGISNCIIDNQKFPRNKLCGGLLTEKTVSLLENTYETHHFPFEKITSTVDLFIGTQKLSSVNAKSSFYLVERKEFDNFLIEQYKIKGGILYEDTQVQKINQEKRQLVLKNGEIINYCILVGADGANSQVRKMLSPNYHPNALCLEANYSSKFVNDNICVYFATIRNGYGWCFPKNRHYTIGIGGKIKKNKNIKEAFIAFSENIGKTISKNEIKGALVPFGEYVKNPCKNNILLVGDAAGLVDPITGEGLYFAIRSSQIAFQSINNYIRNKVPLNRSYNRAIKEIHSIINDAKLFTKIFFNESTRDFFLTLVKGRTNIMKYFCDNILANYNISYMQFPFKYIYVRHKRKMQEKKLSRED